jgi:hypothetical protein
VLHADKLSAHALPIGHLRNSVYVLMKDEMPSLTCLPSTSSAFQPKRRSADADQRDTRKSLSHSDALAGFAGNQPVIIIVEEDFRRLHVTDSPSQIVEIVSQSKVLA